MPRFLLATQPITGHVLPALAIARNLVERGHEVHWYAGARFRARIEQTGAFFEPYRTARDYDDRDLNGEFPGRGNVTGAAQLKFDLLNVFAKPVTDQMHDLEAILKEYPADAILADSSMGAPMLVQERGGPPCAYFSLSCLIIRSRDTAPFGLGMLPDSSPFGRVRNRLLDTLVSTMVFRDAAAETTRQRRELGLPPFRFGALISPYLHLAPTVAGFEYERSDLPPQVHYIGALLPEAPDGVELPAWWGEVAEKRRPVVLVTQGTSATDPSQLFAPAIKGLAGEDVLVVAAGVRSTAELGIDPLPDNVRIAAYLPFDKVMPHVDAYVTNGGFGGLMYALSSGAPIVTGGTTEDKPETNARVGYSGVGINLKTATPQPEQVRDAVKRVLTVPEYRRKAQQLQAELARHDAPCEAAHLLERLAATRQPVLRPQPLDDCAERLGQLAPASI